MRAALASVTALFVGIALLLMGNGLHSTLLGVRAGIEAFSTTAFGVITAFFYVGWVVGSLRAPVIVRRVGHIRTFAALAAIAAVAAVACGYFIDPVHLTREGFDVLVSELVPLLAPE